MKKRIQADSYISSLCVIFCFFIESFWFLTRLRAECTPERRAMADLLIKRQRRGVDGARNGQALKSSEPSGSEDLDPISRSICWHRSGRNFSEDQRGPDRSFPGTSWVSIDFVYQLNFVCTCRVEFASGFESLVCMFFSSAVYFIISLSSNSSDSQLCVDFDLNGFGSGFVFTGMWPSIWMTLLEYPYFRISVFDLV